jgi:hypothetical protein
MLGKKPRKKLIKYYISKTLLAFKKKNDKYRAH